MKKTLLVVALLLCVLGCIPGITVSRKDARIDDRPPVEYQLGSEVEMKDWVELKSRVCNDLGYATEGLPDDVRKKIFLYACLENNRSSLGEVLKQLTPQQLERICTRLAEKGYAAKIDKVPTTAESLGAALAVFLILLI